MSLFLKKIFVIIFLSVFLSGCLLDSLFNKADDEIPLAVDTEYMILNGKVLIADTTAKVKGIAYKPAPRTAKVFLLPDSISWTDKLKFRDRYIKVTGVDVDGLYQFERVEKKRYYCVIVDIDNNGTADEVKTGIYSDTNDMLSSFVRELNDASGTMMSVNMDKGSYGQGDLMNISVSGYLASSSELHLEVWNEAGSGKYLWSSVPVSKSSGEVSLAEKITVPVNGWPSSSTGAEYRVYVVSGTLLLDSEFFVITGNNPGDTTPPDAGSVVINSNAPRTGEQNVKLEISVPDSTATQMKVTNNYSMIDKQNWETVATEKNWKLSEGYGLKTVYVIFADNSGNKTTSFSDTINYIEFPGVLNVTSASPDGSYKSGDTIDVQVEFSQSVVVTGNPLLTLDTAGAVSYFSGSGTKTLNFRYTPGGENISKLKYTTVDALNANGGTIRNSVGEDAELTLPAPGNVNSLDYNRSIVIDNVIPGITSVWSVDVDADGVTDAIEVQFSEPVLDSSVNPSDWQMDEQGESAWDTFDSMNTWVNKIASAGFDNDRYVRLKISSPTNITSTSDMNYRYNGGSVTDLAGNPLGVKAITVVDKDIAAPVVKSWYIDFNPDGDSKNIVFDFSEDVNVIDFDIARIGISDKSGNGRIFLEGNSNQIDADTIKVDTLTSGILAEFNDVIVSFYGNGSYSIGNFNKDNFPLFYNDDAFRDTNANKCINLPYTVMKTASAAILDTTGPVIVGCQGEDTMTFEATIVLTFSDYMSTSADLAANYNQDPALPLTGEVVNGIEQSDLYGKLVITGEAWADNTVLKAENGVRDLGGNPVDTSGNGVKFTDVNNASDPVNNTVGSYP